MKSTVTLVHGRDPLRYNYRVTSSFIRWGAIFGFVGVALGAFGAHGLQGLPHMTAKYMDVYRTGVQYQLFHAVALLFVGLFAERLPNNALVQWTGRLFIAGIILFAGSLYALTLTSILPTGPILIFGPFTPLGGVCFLTGWALLAVAASGRKANV